MDTRVSGAGGDDTEILRFGDIVFDRAGHVVWDGKGQISLTPAEFLLLDVFVRSPGRVLSRDHLMNEVAGHTAESYDRSVDMLVARLRRKIERDPNKPELIVTMPRVGYKFAARPQRDVSAARPSAPAADLAPQSQQAPAGRMAQGPLPGPLERPSIAVLPFQNMSGDADQDYFADGIVDDITTALSRMRWLFVIARNSSFTYKGRAVDVKQVGVELGVRYVLEGSVRKAAGRVRITCQLIDTSNGAHLWADKFDSALDDVFELQDQVTASVVGALGPKLEQAEIERARRKPTEKLDAYDYYLRGMACAHRIIREDTSEAIRLFAKAIELDPDFAAPYGAAAYCYVVRKMNGWIADPARDVAEASRLTARVAELGNEDAIALTFGGFALGHVVGDLDKGIALVDKARALNPNFATAWCASGTLRAYRGGEPDVVVEHLAQAMLLSPFDPLMFAMQGMTAYGHFNAGRHQEAIAWAEKAVHENPRILLTLRIAAACNVAAGRLEEARSAMVRALEIDPEMRVSNLNVRLPKFHRPEDRARYVDCLRKAGLPE